MTEYSSIEQYAEAVSKQSMSLVAELCRALGPDHRATMKALAIGREASGIVQGSRMRQEQSGTYDLAALKVDATRASNSETGFEDRG